MIQLGLALAPRRAGASPPGGGAAIPGAPAEALAGAVVPPLRPACSQEEGGDR